MTIVPSTVGKVTAMDTPEQEWGLGRRRAEGGSTATRRRRGRCASRWSRSTASRPTFSIAPTRPCCWPKRWDPTAGVCIDTFHHQHRRGQPGRGNPQHSRAACRLSRRRQQPHGLRHGLSRLAPDRQHTERDRLRRCAHGRVRRATRFARRPTPTRTQSPPPKRS